MQADGRRNRGGHAQVPENGRGRAAERRVFRKGWKAETAEEMNERLIRWLNSPMDKMPYIAIQELQEAGKERMPAIVEALSSPDCSIRANAALLLSKAGGRWALRPLMKKLNDASPAVCAIAEMAICEIVKRNFAKMKPESVETIAARLSGRYGRELDRLLGKDVPEPKREKGDDI